MRQPVITCSGAKGTLLKVGARVQILSVSVDEAKTLQSSHGGLNQQMEQLLGQYGVVFSITGTKTATATAAATTADHICVTKNYMYQKKILIQFSIMHATVLLFSLLHVPIISNNAGCNNAIRVKFDRFGNAEQAIWNPMMVECIDADAGSGSGSGNSNQINNGNSTSLSSSGTSFSVNDRVKVKNLTLGQLTSAQVSHGGFSDGMERLMGVEGVVTDIDRDGDVHVSYQGMMSICWNPVLLELVEGGKSSSSSLAAVASNCPFSVGDRVRFRSIPVETMQEMQENHGGVNDSMVNFIPVSGRCFQCKLSV